MHVRHLELAHELVHVRVAHKSRRIIVVVVVVSLDYWRRYEQLVVVVLHRHALVLVDVIHEALVGDEQLEQVGLVRIVVIVEQVEVGGVGGWRRVAGRTRPAQACHSR